MRDKRTTIYIINERWCFEPESGCLWSDNVEEEFLKDKKLQLLRLLCRQPNEWIDVGTICDAIGTTPGTVTTYASAIRGYFGDQNIIKEHNARWYFQATIRQKPFDGDKATAKEIRTIDDHLGEAEKQIAAARGKLGTLGRRLNARTLLASGAIAGTALFLVIPQLKKIEPSELVCPPVIYSNEALVRGKFIGGARDAMPVIYVKPLDEQLTYYRDLTPLDWEANGTWTGPRIRFGNPDGIPQDRQPPLDFDVFAVLTRPENAAKFPGTRADPGTRFTSDEHFRREIVLRGGIDNVGPCRVHREPSCQSAPRIVSLDPGQLPAFKGTARFAWTSDTVETYVEIRTKTVRAKEPMTTAAHEITIALEPGLYEITLSPSKDSQCQTKQWFKVLP